MDLRVVADATSSAQDQWVEITAAMRGQLAKQVQRMNDLAPCDAAYLVGAVETAMQLEVNAALFDALLDERLAALAHDAREAAFGG